jgi:hypothetical protein
MTIPETAKKYHEAFIVAENGELPTTIQFAFDNGNVCALPYAYLVEIDFNRSGLITMGFTTRKVEIRGRRLDKLFASLVHYQVVAVRQLSITDVRPPQGECCIDGLVIKANEE